MSTSSPATREEFKQYCLRKLGAGVMQLNISDMQIEDRINDAIQYMNEYHVEGAERIYLKHKVTGSTMTFASASGTWTRGVTLEGATSGMKCTFVDQPAGHLTCRFFYSATQVSQNEGKSWVAGETVSNGTETGVLAATNPIVLGDIDNGYITISDGVLEIYQLVALANSTANMFDFRYQYALNYIYDIAFMDLVNYQITKNHFALLENLFVGTKPLEFNRYSNKLKIYWDWHKDTSVDCYIILEALALLDPASWPKMYNNLFLKEYATALLKRQWGQNLTKFDGMKLPGDVAVNGQKILDEGNKDVEKWEEKIRSEFQPPVGIIVG